MSTQAERIIGKFGGVAKTAAAIGYDRASVYRWTYSREKGGCDGYVPTGAIRKIQAAAKTLKIEMKPEDLAI